jgi:DUF1680 family protein
MYSSSEVNTKIGNERLQLIQKTNYPWDGNVNITINKAPSIEKQLNFRVPDWCQKASIYVNGKRVNSSSSSNSYITISQKWNQKDEITFVMEMPVQLIEANPMVEETRNQVAVKRGPLVYCLEANDLNNNQKLSDIIIPYNIDLRPEKMMISNSMITSLTGEAKTLNGSRQKGLYQPLNNNTSTTNIRLIPYYAWANRAEADMAVWLPLSR